MKLLVDIGNTRLKSALLIDGALVSHKSLSWQGEDLASGLTDLWAGMSPSDVAISSVASGEVVDAVCRHALRDWGVEAKDAKVRSEVFGLSCGYHQPSSLGIDRWMAMLGAWGRRQGPWLVADLGTAATLDVIDRRGQHLGGCIFAGIETQRRALSRQTAALPEVNVETRALLAQDTRGGVALGTLLSVVGGVRELFESSKSWPGCEGIRLCLTGGASPVVSERLGVEHDVFPSLVLEGLAMSEFGLKISMEEPIANSL